MGVVIVVFTFPYLDLYKVSADVKVYAKYLLWIFAFYLWVKVSNMVMTGGVLRSGGKTKYTLLLDTVGTWGIGIPIGLLCAFGLKCDLPVVYACLSLEEVFRLAVGIVIIRKKVWMRKIES